jgi:serine/threonine-protein kinase
MSAVPPGPSADRNLLFGILAMQMDFVGKDELIATMHAWVLAKTRPLGDLLAEQGALKPEHRTLLDALVQAHLAQHGGDPARSLAALSSIGSARRDLEQVADPDVQASLGVVASARPTGDPNATAAKGLGELTSTGLRFRVLRPHARGGLGEVFVARDEELNREVALKEIQPRYADDPQSRARFLLEAEVTGGLEHPGVVPVYGLGTHADGRPFYAMRFIKGDNLQEAIRRIHGISSSVPKRKRKSRRGPLRFNSLEFRQLLRRFIDICNAVAYAHSRGIIRRDLKPSNVMLGKYGETLIVDWGLAKPIRRPAHHATLPAEEREATLRPHSGMEAATTIGRALGTPGYMSPEQAAGRLDELGPATDIYSLGATLYHLLTGRAPFEGRGRDIETVLEDIQAGAFPPPRQVRVGVPRPLEAVCLKAMARRPEDRYVMAQELAADIERWLADEPVGAYEEPLLQQIARSCRRRPVEALVSAVGLLYTPSVIFGAVFFGATLDNPNLGLTYGFFVPILVLSQYVLLCVYFSTTLAGFWSSFSCWQGVAFFGPFAMLISSEARHDIPRSFVRLYWKFLRWALYIVPISGF